MKRMVPLIVALVLVLAPAAWGYNITITDSTIGFQSKALVGLANVSGTPSSITEPGVYKAFDALAQAYNGVPFLGPVDMASSDWLAKVYQPVVTWGPGGVGKITSITQIINVSMLLSFTHPYVAGTCGDFTNILTSFSAIREDTSTIPQATIDLSWSGVAGTSGPNMSTWFYHQPAGFFPPPPENIIPQNNTPPALQTADATGLAVLLANTEAFELYLDLVSALSQLAPATIDPTNPATYKTFSSNIYLIETLNLTEPNMVNSAVIPVPPSLILFGSGLIGLGFMTRLRRRQN